MIYSLHRTWLQQVGWVPAHSEATPFKAAEYFPKVITSQVYSGVSFMHPLLDPPGWKGDFMGANWGSSIQFLQNVCNGPESTRVQPTRDFVLWQCVTNISARFFVTGNTEAVCVSVYVCLRLREEHKWKNCPPSKRLCTRSPLNLTCLSLYSEDYVKVCVPVTSEATPYSIN